MLRINFRNHLFRQSLELHTDCFFFILSLNMKLVIAIVFFSLTRTTKLLWKMKLWNKTLDGSCLRDFNLLFESRQHDTEMSEITFLCSSEKREGEKTKPVDWVG